MRKIVLSLLILPLMLSSCMEDINLDVTLDNKELRQWDVNAPLAKINIDIETWIWDILNDDDDVEVYIREEDGLVVLKYYHSDSLDWKNLKSLDDSPVTWTFQPDFRKRNFELEFSESVDLAYNEDARFDRLTYAKGSIEIGLDLPEGAKGKIEFTIPEIKERGNPLKFTRNIPLTDNSPEKLENGEINFTNNLINIESKITFEDFPASFTGEISVTFAIKDMEIEEAWGYFGKIEEKEDESDFRFGFFEDLQIAEHLVFGDIIFSAHCENAIGVPFEITIFNPVLFKEDEEEQIRGTLEKNNGEEIGMEITSAEFNGTINSGKGDLLLDQNNSNILTMGNLFPNRIKFDLVGFSNPKGEIVNGNAVKNYIGKQNKTKVDFMLEFPFEFSSDLYERRDTIEFDVNDIFGDNKDLVEHFKTLDLYLNIKNKMPFDIDVTVFVIDDKDEWVANISEENETFCVSGVPNADGRIPDPQFEMFVLSITGAQLLDYMDKEVKHLVIYTKSNTYNSGGQLVKVFGDSGMNINVSMEVKL